MDINQFKTITNQEYLNLKDPEFIGQTKLNTNNEYWMCWFSAGTYYKTKNKIQ